MLRTTLIAAVAAALLAPASALAAPGWTPPETVTTLPWVGAIDAALGSDRSVGLTWTDGSSYHVATGPAGAPLHLNDPLTAWWGDLDADSAGTITLAWAIGNAVNVATRPAGGAFGEPVKIADAGAQVYVDVSPGGTTLVAWRGPTGLRARVRLPGGDFGPEEILSATDVNDIAVAVADAGEAVAVWRTQSGTPQQMIRPAGGTFPSQPSGFGDLTGVSELDVVMNARGDAQLLLSANDGEGKSRFGGGHRGPGEAFRYDGEVSEPISSSSTPSVAIGENGVGVLAWVSGPLAQASVRRGESYGEPQTLSTGEFEAGTVAAAVTPEGEAVVGWDESGDEDATLQIARRAADRDAFGAPVELDTAGEQVDDLLLRSNAGGDVLAAYTADSGAETRVRYTLLKAAPKTPVTNPTPGRGRPATATPPPGGAPGSEPATPRSAPASTARVVRLRGLKVRRRGGRALVRFTLTAPAKVTLTLERRQGRRWKTTRRALTVQGRAGLTTASLRLRGVSGRLRIVAKVAGSTARTTAAVPAPRR